LFNNGATIIATDVQTPNTSTEVSSTVISEAPTKIKMPAHSQVTASNDWASTNARLVPIW